MDFKLPFIFADKDELKPKQDEDLALIEELYLRNQMILDHEQYRKDVWLPYKLFRGTYDNERFMSESILDQKDITQKKKELDKQMIGAIRVAIVNDEHDKVFTYLELLNFTTTIKVVVKLCNELQQNHLAQRISKYIDEKAEKDVLSKQYT